MHTPKISRLKAFLIPGVVYEFLTWEAFGPLSRMSYCLFLLHFSVMDVIFANITYPVDFGHFLGVST